MNPLRKYLLDRIDKWELQSLDNQAALWSYLVTLGQSTIALAAAFGYLSPLLFPFLLVIALIVSAAVFVPYRLAMIKNAIDLRIAVINFLGETATETVAYGAVVLLLFSMPPGSELTPASIITFAARFVLVILFVALAGFLAKYLSRHIWHPDRLMKRLRGDVRETLYRTPKAGGVALAVFVIWLIGIPAILLGVLNIPRNPAFDPSGLIGWTFLSGVFMLASTYSAWHSWSAWKRRITKLAATTKRRGLSKAVTHRAS